MNIRIKFAAAAGSLLLALTACTTATEPTVEPTQPMVTAETVQPEMSDELLYAIVADSVWENMPPSDRASVCYGIATDPDMMRLAFQSEISADQDPVLAWDAFRVVADRECK